MALNVTTAKRQFIFKKDGDDIKLEDPNPELSIEEVKKLYSGKHPELTNATISGPMMQDDSAVYNFSTSVGKKG